MDDDLGNVLRNLNRSTCVARGKLANHPLTRAYLDAGVRLLEEGFFSRVVNNDSAGPRPFMWISRGQVVKEVERGSCDLPRKGSHGSFRDRWPYFSDYLGDLIRYTLRVDTLQDQIDLAKDIRNRIGGDPALILHEVAYRKLVLMVGETAMRFKIFVSAFADCDPVVAEALQENYVEVAEAWHAIYTEFFHIWGVRLRPGLSLDDLMAILASVADGLTLRVTSDDTPSVLDHQQRRCLLGTAVIALLVAFIDPGNGETLDEAFNEIVTSSS